MMRYAQIKSGQKLHIVHEPGEEHRGAIVRAGCVSQPLCGRRVNHYRMTINMPMGHACKNCVRVRERSAA